MFNIRKAERKQAKLRLALTGVSGSGKSLSAIYLAKGMGKKFVVIDTEQGSADLYADVADYDVLPLDKPFTPDRYIAAIKACEDAGYETIIIDSLSHAWAGEGGVLDMQDAATSASRHKNSYMSWREVTPHHNRLVNAILHSKSHIIVTMRAKTHYEVVDNNGKKTPVKVGLAPVQREGLDYEFTVVLDIDKDSHVYTSSKDRTRLFEGKHEIISLDTGRRVNDWLEDGRNINKVEAEEAERLKNIIMLAQDENSLREAYRLAKNTLPARENYFVEAAKLRKMDFDQQGVQH